MVGSQTQLFLQQCSNPIITDSARKALSPTELFADSVYLRAAPVNCFFTLFLYDLKVCFHSGLEAIEMHL